MGEIRMISRRSHAKKSRSQSVSGELKEGRREEWGWEPFPMSLLFFVKNETGDASAFGAAVGRRRARDFISKKNDSFQQSGC